MCYLFDADRAHRRLPLHRIQLALSLGALELDCLYVLSVRAVRTKGTRWAQRLGRHANETCRSHYVQVRVGKQRTNIINPRRRP